MNPIRDLGNSRAIQNTQPSLAEKEAKETSSSPIQSNLHSNHFVSFLEEITPSNLPLPSNSSTSTTSSQSLSSLLLQSNPTKEKNIEKTVEKFLQLFQARIEDSGDTGKVRLGDVQGIGADGYRRVIEGAIAGLEKQGYTITNQFASGDLVGSEYSGNIEDFKLTIHVAKETSSSPIQSNPTNPTKEKNIEKAVEKLLQHFQTQPPRGNPATVSVFSTEIHNMCIEGIGTDGYQRVIEGVIDGMEKQGYTITDHSARGDLVGSTHSGNIEDFKLTIHVAKD